jgi:hypothetical protein
MVNFSDTFCDRFLNGKIKMAAKFGGHFVMSGLAASLDRLINNKYFINAKMV